MDKLVPFSSRFSHSEITKHKRNSGQCFLVLSMLLQFDSSEDQHDHGL
jgi:hypothetical protein